jgi:hypothetical protein
MAELKPVVEARLRGAEKITQVVEDEVTTSLREPATPSGREPFPCIPSPTEVDQV